MPRPTHTLAAVVHELAAFIRKCPEAHRLTLGIQRRDSTTFAVDMNDDVWGKKERGVGYFVRRVDAIADESAIEGAIEAVESAIESLRADETVTRARVIVYDSSSNQLWSRVIGVGADNASSEARSITAEGHAALAGVGKQLMDAGGQLAKTNVAASAELVRNQGAELSRVYKALERAHDREDAAREEAAKLRARVAELEANLNDRDAILGALAKVVDTPAGQAVIVGGVTMLAAGVAAGATGGWRAGLKGGADAGIQSIRDTLKALGLDAEAMMASAIKEEQARQLAANGQEEG